MFRRPPDPSFQLTVCASWLQGGCSMYRPKQAGQSHDGDGDDDDENEDNGQMLLVEYRLRWALHYSVTGNPPTTTLL